MKDRNAVELGRWERFDPRSSMAWVSSALSEGVLIAPWSHPAEDARGRVVHAEVGPEAVPFVEAPSGVPVSSVLCVVVGR
jgi:hypothetical protein